MSGHAIRLDLSRGTYLAMVCLEPETAVCRQLPSCGCETVNPEWIEGGQCICGNDGCGQLMSSMAPDACHIVMFCEELESSCADDRTFLIPVEITWDTDMATWMLPEHPTATEATQ